MKKPTITDVAELAGVSIKTVSRVLNQEPNVRPATHSKVSQAIAELNYRPSISARSLAGNRSYLLALLYDNPSASYVTNIQSGVLQTCRAHNYEVLIHPCKYQDPALEKNITDLVQNSRVDGLILTPPLTDSRPLLALLKRLETPYVLISPSSNSRFTWAVGTNDEAICSEMVQHLCGLGHRRIAFILGHPDHSALANRYAGYQQGLKACGLRESKQLCVQGFNSFESGEQCARQLLKLKRPPTAIFACNDDMAAGAMKVAHESGLDVPGQLSVAGFDDIPLASQVWPSLTTVKQPIQKMGELATELLLLRFRQHSPKDFERITKSQLVIRNSTGPAP